MQLHPNTMETYSWSETFASSLSVKSNNDTTALNNIRLTDLMKINIIIVCDVSMQCVTRIVMYNVKAYICFGLPSWIMS